ncbi:hypothetical protein [Burkholderia gladioli]|uniref:hypothetical protein n=1 Tax=Burkholderia gladioli TaxID=28095 RepID=UPI00163FCE76|nr:hypothetical protein [Burkholderia gladioli]
MYKFLRERLAVLCTGSAMLTVASGLALYLYLRQIGWPELLQSALLSPIGVGTVVVSIVVILFCAIATFYAGAYWLTVCADSFGGGRHVPKNIEVIIITIHLVWSLIIFATFIPAEKYPDVMVHHFPSAVGWIASNLPEVSVCFVLFSSILMWIYGFRQLKNSWRAAHLYPMLIMISQPRGFNGGLVNYFRKLTISFPFGVRGGFVSMASLNSSFAALVFLEMNPKLGAADFSWTTAAIVVVTMWPGIVVGCVYIANWRKTENVKNALRACLLFGGMVALWGILSFPATFLLPLDFLSLGLASIYSNTPHHYQVLKKESRSIFEYAGLSSRYDEPYVITAYDRFRFGDVLLVCASSYNPLKTSSRGDDLREVGGCVSSDKTELRRVDPPNAKY